MGPATAQEGDEHQTTALIATNPTFGLANNVFFVLAIRPPLSLATVTPLHSLLLLLPPLLLPFRD
jgi:hypothetical protein